MGTFDSLLQTPSDPKGTEKSMEDEDQDRPRPEIAEAFYNELGHQQVCTRCSKRACVKYINVYFCARCWEYIERPEDD